MRFLRKAIRSRPGAADLWKSALWCKTPILEVRIEKGRDQQQALAGPRGVGRRVPAESGNRRGADQFGRVRLEVPGRRKRHQGGKVEEPPRPGRPRGRGHRRPDAV